MYTTPPRIYDHSQVISQKCDGQCIVRCRKRRENCGKRNYTEEELTAAVSDIRSGKLGTRRAAALYGVPRSTLRNKIFRLDTGSPQSWLATDTLPQATDLPPEFFHDGHLVTEYGEWEKKLQQLRRKHDLGAGHKRPFGMPPLFFSNEHFLECQKAFGCSNPYLYDLKLPFLQQLVRKLTKERVGAKSLCVDREPRCGVATGDAAEVFSGGGGCNNVELQIPSYKPMRNNKSEEEAPVNGSLALGIVDCARPNKTIGESLKDIIVKSIAQKVRTRVMLNNANKTPPALEPKFAVACENGHWEAPLKKDSEAAPETKRMKLAMKSSKAVATTEEDDGKHGRRQKQTRPKRGQYRKYNSQLLMEAVQSVQRGEMSVHRAGSFYGVPHSTLEYKVKERHLLRQKKARENQKKSCDDATSDRRSTSDDNAPLPDETSSSAGEDPANLPLYPISGYVPLSLGWPPFSKGSTGVANIHATGFPPYGSEFGLNTSASELLKKLQQKVQANSALEASMNDEVDTTDSIVVSAVDAQVTVK